MINNNFSDLDTAFDIVVTLKGGVREFTQFATENMLAFKDLPTWKYDTFPKKENRFNPNHSVTQFIFKSLGNPDDKSFEQQIGKIQRKYVSGKLQKQYPKYTEQDYILAQILSKMWDMCGGKVSGSEVSYKSNTLNFNAHWDWSKDKFVIQSQ